MPTVTLTSLRDADGCAGTAQVNLAYDEQGNLDNKSGVHFDFDYGNRLRSASYDAETLESYQYDGHGRRVKSIASNGTIHSLYSQGGQLLYQDNARTGKRTNYYYLAGSLVNEVDYHVASGTYANRYQHTDALGSPVVVTNGPHVILERNEYEPYGQLLNRPLTDGPGYTGHVKDAQTGLNYMQQRYYDPMIGRFLSVDPVTAYSMPGANFNRYWYANDNPYRFKDLDGRIAYQVNNTIYIPVTFTGSGVTPELIKSVVEGASKLGTSDGTRFVVVPVDRVLGGVNVMNVSPGNTNPNTRYGEGIIKSTENITWDSAAHIDSRRSDLTGAVLHDTLHFAHLIDRYTENPSSTFGNRGRSTPLPGFENSIMGTTSGSMLKSQETAPLYNAFNGLYGKEEWDKLQQQINDEK